MLPPIYKRPKSLQRNVTEYPRVTAWVRRFQRHAQGRKREAVAIDLAPPTSVTYIWGPGTKNEINSRMVEEAARLLGVNRSRIIGVDLGDEKTFWIANGITTDVVTYKRARSGRS